MWTDLGGGLSVRQSRAYAMNSVLLLAGDRAVLVDPGVLPSELDDLAARSREAGVREASIVFTHAHWDHVLGLPWWPGAETIAHDGAARLLRQRAKDIEREARACAERHGERFAKPFEPFEPKRAVSGLHFTTVQGARMVFRDAPGHAADQLTVHLPERGVLIAADMLSDIEIPMLEGAIAEYRRTLDALVPLVEGGAIETIVPGHGAIATGDEVPERFAKDLAYLRVLEEGVAACREEGFDAEEACQRLAELEYPGKSDSMEPYHQANIRLAYDQAGRAAKRPARVNGAAGPPKRKQNGRGPKRPRRRKHAP